MYLTFKGKIKKISILLTALILLLSLSNSALALNSTDYFGEENKSFNFYGYKYVNATHLILYFDKYVGNGTIPTDYFSISGGHSVINAKSTSGNNASGVTGTGISTGGHVELTLDSPLSTDTSYTLTILNTFATWEGISLGNYINREDFSFGFRTPDSNGYYTGEPRITFWPASREEVAYEGNITLIVDRPVAQTSISSILSGLSSNFLKDNNQVTQDILVDDTSVPGAETYRPFANDAGTAFIFPLTVSNEDYYFSVYNLTYDSGSHEYTLEVPEFNDVSGNYYDDKDILNFTTYEEDIVGWLSNTPTATVTGLDEITVGWDETTITSGSAQQLPDTYKIYMSTTNPYINIIEVTSNATITENNGHYTAVMSGLTTSTYWFRIVPSLNGKEAGFSPATYATDL